jgi:hypothetical protein
MSGLGRRDRYVEAVADDLYSSGIGARSHGFGERFYVMPGNPKRAEGWAFSEHE